MNDISVVGVLHLTLTLRPGLRTCTYVIPLSLHTGLHFVGSLNVITLNNVHTVLCNTWNISRELQDRQSTLAGTDVYSDFFTGCNRYVYGLLGQLTVTGPWQHRL